MNETNMEGQIRLAAHCFLGFDEKFLKSGNSLLEKLKERISPGWLKTVARVIYNSGGRMGGTRGAKAPHGAEASV